jgi:uncharacterized protein YijF (DUF1287 family)
MARTPTILTTLILTVAAYGSTADKIVEGARKQLTLPAVYTPGYFRIAYPNGDLPPSQGVCTDVVVRALRNAGYDMQKLIHEDMRKRFSRYPRREAHPDSNIDHRRVPNLVFYFRSYGKRLPTAVTPNILPTWRPGDFVFWKLPSGLDHCGVISDRKNQAGIPYVIHNINRTAEEDVLPTWTIVGHYRFPK